MTDTTAETVFVTLLEQGMPGVRVVTEAPANLGDLPKCVRVTVFGGTGEDVWTFTRPSVDFDCFAPSRAAARDLAYDVRKYLRTHAVGQTVGNAFVARVNPGTEPFWAPWDNTGLRRFTYSTSARLHTVQGV